MRARSIKPGLLKNEILGTEDPLLTILFEGLWMLADREGRLEDRPIRIRGEVFPYRDGVDVDALLDRLARHGFIARYQVDELSLIEIDKFSRHQSPHRNEKPSELPSLSKATQVSDSAWFEKRDEALAKRAEALRPDRGLLTADSGLLTPDVPASVPASETPPEAAPKSKAKPKRPPPPKPEWADGDDWRDYLQARRAKRHVMTERALTGCVESIERVARDVGRPPGMLLAHMAQTGWAQASSEGFAKLYHVQRAPPEPDADRSAKAAANFHAKHGRDDGGNVVPLDAGSALLLGAMR